MSEESGGESPPFLVTRSGRLASQQAGELFPFIELLVSRGVRSYLEVGARHGDTFYEVMKSLPVRARGVAVDMPNGPWGGDSQSTLNDCISELEDMGYSVCAVFGDSRKVVDTVRALGPFDAVLIDADHRYDGVKADWEKYGDAPLVAFHDIDGHGLDCGGMTVEVPRLWAEIKQTRPHVEFIAPSDDRRMGIGVLL